ncbi:MAG: phosphatidylserine decarboxylase [Proteobacteria bacterium]|nr:phosphatidylserine decarboxylase [Pseudomonadota bacterium]
MGRFSKIEQPLVRDLSLWAWKLFTELDLSDAKKARFTSVHDCFTRELKPGARVVDADAAVLASPCDAIVGQCGVIQGQQVFQAKGFPYSVTELFGNGDESAKYEGGCYVTLRLRSSMYHRFHAPYDCRLRHVTYISGDTWNVNPIALKRVEKLFCKNERAAIRCELPGGQTITLVAVAAVLVASIRLPCLGTLFHPRYTGPNEIACDAVFQKGQEIGWFEHGSTIIVFAPKGFELAEGIREGQEIRMGCRLMTLGGAGNAVGSR